MKKKEYSYLPLVLSFQFCRVMYVVRTKYQLFEWIQLQWI